MKDARDEQPNVQVQLCLDVDADRAKAISGVRAWFSEGLSRLGYQLRDQLDAAVADDTYLGMDNQRRSAGGITAKYECRRQSGGKRRKWEGFYSPKTRDRFYKRLDDLPEIAGFDIRTWQPEPDFPVMFPLRPWLMISSVSFDDEIPGWILLHLSAEELMLTGSPTRDQTIVDFIRAVADLCGPTAGEVSYEHGGFRGAFEDAHNLVPTDTMQFSRDVIRGFGWITVLSQEIGDRFGGVQGLRDIGAFHEVFHLANGGYLLRATPLFHDFQVPEARRLAEVLEPALPQLAREPARRSPWDVPNMIQSDPW